MVGCWAAHSHDSRGNPPAACTMAHHYLAAFAATPLDVACSVVTFILPWIFVFTTASQMRSKVSACRDVVRSPSKVSAVGTPPLPVLGLTASADLSPDLSAPLH